MSTTSESSVAPLPPRPPILAAGTPFDKPSADIVLRTADGVHFRIHSHILAVASPFFEIMFSLPQSHSSSTGDAQTTDSNGPVIDIAEDSATLDALLRICYPLPKQDTVYSLNRLEALWTAAVKYEMALPIEVLRKQLLEAADFSPIASWAVASRVGLEILARRAAEKTLETSLKVAESDLVGVTAADFYRLREFHRAEGRVPVDFRLLTPSKHATIIDGRAHTSVPSAEPLMLKQDMPFADLICRSSDGVEFEVHRWVISTASAMLYQRITSINPANIHEKPVLKLDEDSTVVSALLGLCYQPYGELPTNPTSLYNVLVAAQKYGMEGVMKAVQNRWTKSPVQGVDALSFYLIAACLRWKEITQVVAAYTLSDPLPGAEGQPQVLMPTTAPLYSPFMESTPAVVYLRLIRYHETYQLAMQDIFQRSRCQLPLSKVLYKAILSPHDAISFTSQAVIESYQHGHTQGKKEYYANNSSSGDTQRLRNALNEVAKLMKELSIEV